jgi:autotransporter-associated beta strand protein
MATRQWIVTTSGTFSFNSPFNWQFGDVPSANDIAEFNSSGIPNDTITGNATIAELLVGQGNYSFAGNYTISGALPTELSVIASGIILPGASVSGNEAVSVTGLLTVQGTLIASGLSISNHGGVWVWQGSSLDISGPISINNGSFTSSPAPNQSAGPTVAIDNAIQASGADTFASYEKQETDFNGVISGPGSITLISDNQPSSVIALNGNNTYTGGTTIKNETTVAAGNANAFGMGNLTITSGELLATTTETIANPLSMTPAFTIAAAHGQTLTIGAGAWTLNPNLSQAITFGAPGQDGTVVLKDTGGATINAGNYGVVIQAGTLRSGSDDGLSLLVSGASSVIVQSGATLREVGSVSMTLNGLSGGGRITNSGGSATLVIDSTQSNSFDGFEGVIDGAFAVTISGFVILTGDNTYTGGTTINSGSGLTLGNNGTGSVTGNIVDNGILVIFHNDAVTVNNVSGSGILGVQGTGTTTLGSGNSYSGGTEINSGILAVGNPAALGSGNLVVFDGELLGTATETISTPGTVSIFQDSTIAAAHGQTLTINPATLTFNASSINFGAAGQDGVVSFIGGTVSDPGAYTVTIQAGTLRAADNTGIGNLLDNDTATTVAAGATLDIAGFSFSAANLQGSGQVANSGAAATLSLIDGGNFSGTIGGPLSLTIASGSTTLSGNNTYTGTTKIVSGAFLFLGVDGTSGSVAGSIVDNGILSIVRSDTLTLKNVSGSGSVTQEGSGHDNPGQRPQLYG